MRNWILIADAATARIFARRIEEKELDLVRELSHPLSRAKGVDLLTDRPGRTRQPSRGAYASTMQAPTAAKAIEAEEFARQLSHELKHALDRREFEQVAILAPPHFLGLLRQALAEQVARRVVFSGSADLTHIERRALWPHLCDAIAALSPDK